MTQAMQHSAGPWGVQEAQTHPSNGAVLGYYVAVIDPTQKDGFNGRVGQTFSNCLTGTDEVALANATLFAAAPELLAALQTAEMAMLGYTVRNKVITKALADTRAAIAKATGSAA